jgi:hypothetical protein
VNAEIAGPLETAYQRFIRAELSSDVASTRAEQWLELVREFVGRSYNVDPVVIIGYDPDDDAART